MDLTQKNNHSKKSGTFSKDVLFCHNIKTPSQIKKYKSLIQKADYKIYLLLIRQTKNNRDT